MQYEIKNQKFSPEGRKRIEWAEREMPVVSLIAKDFLKKKPLKGLRLSACLHVTAETANLMRALKDGGANVALCASNPLSTQDDIAASLIKDFGISVFAIRGINRDGYYKHIKKALAHRPAITMDDGADLVSLIHSNSHDAALPMGGTEETTTGVIRLKALAKAGKLLYPIIAVNDAKTKHYFDNRYGTGQSTLDGIVRATNILIAGKIMVIAGYGYCGRGIAQRAMGLGAHVVIAEIDPIRALEATMDGFSVMPLKHAARVGDIFITVTGNTTVITKEHFLLMKNGAMVANAGHFDVEIDLISLKQLSKKTKTLKPLVEEHTLKSNGRKIVVLAQGRLVNLACAEGHPSSVMDMSFANQALSAAYLSAHAEELRPQVVNVPEAIDKQIAKMKLNSMGILIDNLTDRQKSYLNSWTIGT